MSKVNYKIVLIAALSIFISASVFSQQKAEIKPKAIKSLIAGINSDNNGVRRNSIYFAGEYKIKEASKALVEVFKKEKSAGNKILIAFSLYRIGDCKCIEELAQISKSESDLKVKTICNAVYEQFNEDNLLGIK